MDFAVVFGAPVKPDGTPSGATLRRVESAMRQAGISADIRFLLTGTPDEVAMMRGLLARSGGAENRMLLDTGSTDTLSSVVRCSGIIRGQTGVRSVTVCTDRYHIPRCRWLFHLMGVRTRPGTVSSGWRQNGLAKWTWFYLREFAAIIVDTLLIRTDARRSPPNSVG